MESQDNASRSARLTKLSPEGEGRLVAGLMYLLSRGAMHDGFWDDLSVTVETECKGVYKTRHHSGGDSE